LRVVVLATDSTPQGPDPTHHNGTPCSIAHARPPVSVAVRRPKACAKAGRTRLFFHKFTPFFVKSRSTKMSEFVRENPAKPSKIDSAAA